MSELLEICPPQFVEGINECARYEYDEGLLNVSNYSELAIEYDATKSYCITSVDLFIATAGA